MSKYWEGTKGDDWLWGAPDDETIFGLDGNDKIKGNGGDDSLHGGNGNDWLDGGDGNDLLMGGPAPTSCSAALATTACLISIRRSAWPYLSTTLSPSSALPRATRSPAPSSSGDRTSPTSWSVTMVTTVSLVITATIIFWASAATIQSVAEMVMMRSSGWTASIR